MIDLLKKYPDQGFYSVYNFIPHRAEWMGLIVERRGDVIVTHTVGTETTEEAIKTWCDGALKAYREGVPAAEPADMYDRRTLN